MISFVDITTKNYQNYMKQILEIENLSFPSPWSLKVFQEEIKNSFSHFRVLTVDEVLSGYICFWMFDSEIQLINIAVHPDRRGKGLGYYLLEKMIKEGISKGIQSIWLEVRTSNLAAQSLYQKLGFEEVCRRARYYGDTNEDAIVMSRAFMQKGRYNIAVN